MVKVDLITGFLGAGKTTFIRKYARYLMDQGMNIGILENDLGAINVDMMLLHDLEGEQCELEMVSGGCDRDCYKRRFKTKLIAMGMCGYDRVLIEPSGVFDVDDFFDTLYEEPLDRWYQIGNVITVVDAALQTDLSREADYVLASEAADAGCVLLSRSQEVIEEQIQDTIRHLNRALKDIQCKRVLKDEIFVKNWEEFTDEDFQRILTSGYAAESYQKMSLEDSDIFDSLNFMNHGLSESEMQHTAEQIMKDPACGTVLRIKGFCQKEDKTWVELNATHHETLLRKTEAGQEVLIVIGQKLNEERIRQYLASIRE
mgnify:FL=1